MCGLAGVVAPRLSPDEGLARARTMGAALARRGPDDHGTWSAPEVGLHLAHRRLSILDLSPAGHQPMHSPSQRYCLVYNGEVYNHHELREGLSVPFASTGDTESILAHIDEHGVADTLPRLRGMFALAVYDRQRRRLSLARDRFGQKPLYVGRLDDQLVFCSDLAAVYAGFRSRPPVSPTALAHYLRRGFVAPDDCLLEGFWQIAPGTWEVFDLDKQGAPRVEQTRYFDPLSTFERCRNMAPPSPDELFAALSQAVQRRLLSDVPVKVFLSAGVDSATVAALCAAHGADTDCLTMQVAAGTGHDESPGAATIAHRLDLGHRVFPVENKDILALVSKLPEIYTEPFADSSQLPTTLLCQHAAAAGAKVALGGDGADEFFGGYTRYRWTRLWNNFGPATRQLGAGWARRLAGRIDVEKLRPFLAAETAEDAHRVLHRVWLPDELPLRGPTIDRDPVRGPPFPDSLLLDDVDSYLPGDLLTKVDRASMFHGLEVRAPFLDIDLVETVWRIPAEERLGPMTDVAGKRPLRQMLAARLGHDVVNQKKRGFAVPLADWLRGPLRGWADDLFASRLLDEDGHLDAQRVRARHRAFMDENVSHPHGLWAVLQYLLWRDHHRVR